MSADAIDVLERYEALLEGHFLLSSGLHSDRYCQCARVFEHPPAAEQLASAMSARLSGIGVDVVLSPALGGVLWGYELAKALGIRALFAEREKGGKFELRRGFKVWEGEHVLLAEDVVTTGGSVMELVPLVEAAGAEVAGIAVIVDRSRGQFQPECGFHALIELEFQTYQPGDCPMCARGEPLVKPGSRALEAGGAA